MDGVVHVRGAIVTHKGELVGSCGLFIDGEGLVVVDGENCEVLSLEPKQFIDIGFPGFFAGRAFLELPLGEKDEDGDDKVLFLKLRKAELAQVRQTVDRLVGLHSPDALEDGLARQWRLFFSGVGVIVAGSLICLLGYAILHGIGISVIFYGIPIAGIAMICKSVSQIRRLRTILREVDPGPVTPV
jgi:hypothetical protein